MRARDSEPEPEMNVAPANRGAQDASRELESQVIFVIPTELFGGLRGSAKRVGYRPGIGSDNDMPECIGHSHRTPEAGCLDGSRVDRLGVFKGHPDSRRKHF